MASPDYVRRYFDGPYHALNFGDAAGLRRVLGRFFRRDECAIVRQAVRVLEPVAPRSVLDLGCGAGTLIAALHAQSPLELAAGVDVSASALTVARARLAGVANVTLEHTSVQSCQSLARRFDAVVCIGMLDYVPFDGSLLQRILAAAAGSVVITLPCERAGRQRLLRTLWLHANRVRLRSYREAEVARLCRALGGTQWAFDIGCPPGLEDNIWVVGHRTSIPWAFGAGTSGGWR